LLVASAVLGPWLVLPIGLGYGVAVAWLGTLAAGAILDRRGPEVLMAVTPRR
jgi:ABC-2 type transport system permease protein